MLSTSPKVFISYSHDSPEHAQAVLDFSARLREDGVETVLDRYTKHPEDGWPRWMMRHIRDADYVLMICTERYYLRVMGDESPGQGMGVRWEGHLILQHVYERGTMTGKFIPLILDETSRRFIPDPFRAFTTYNIRDDSSYEDLYKRLTDQANEPPAVAGKLKQLDAVSCKWQDTPPPVLIRVPRLPRHYVRRAREFDALKRQVFRGEAPQVGVIGAGSQVAVQGMAGIGKTVLAAALCRDPDVAARFLDGVIWLTLGQGPNVERRQADLYLCFGDSQPEFRDVESGRMALSRLLADKKCLLVLDDVWSVADARAFDVVGSGGVLLITTRDAGIVRQFGAASVSVDVMEEAHCLALLASASGRDSDALPKICWEIVRECGNLPLAVALVGGMAMGIADPWEQILARLRSSLIHRIQQESPENPFHVNLLRAIEASIDVLSDDYTGRYGEMGIFPEDAHVPEVTLRLLWVSDDFDELDLSTMLRDLTDKSLLFRDEHGHYFIHDIQRAYLRGPQADLAVAHAKLVSAYRERCPKGWASGPEDGYFFDHLLYHHCELGRYDEAFSIVTDLLWLTRQLERAGVPAVLQDCEELLNSTHANEETREVSRVIADTFRLSAHVIEKHPERFPEQLLARLSISRCSSLSPLADAIRTAKKETWLDPVFPSFHQAGGRLVRVIDLLAPAKSIFFLSCGRILIASGHCLLQYDRESGVFMGELASHTAEVASATSCCDGALIASSYQDGTLILTESSSNTEVRRTRAPHSFLANLVEIPGSNLLAGSLNGEVWIIDTDDASFSQLPVGHTASVNAIAVTTCGTRIASGGEDREIRVWNRVSEALELTLRMPEQDAGGMKLLGSPTSLAIAPDGSRLIAANGSWGPIRTWDLNTGQELESVGGVDDYSIAIQLASDGRRLIVGGHFKWVTTIDTGIKTAENIHVRIWDLGTGSAEEELTGHTSSISGLATCDEGLLLSSSRDSTVRLWNLNADSSAQRTAWSKPGNATTRGVEVLHFHPTEPLVLAGSKSEVILFSREDGKRVNHFPKPRDRGAATEIDGMCFSPSGRVLIAIGLEYSEGKRTTLIEEYDHHNGDLLRVFQGTLEVDDMVAYFKGFEVVAGGKYVVAVGPQFKDGPFTMNQAIAVWSVESGEIVRIIDVPTPNHGKPFASPSEWTTAVSFDGSYYVSSTAEDEFRVCFVNDGFLAKPVGEHDGWVAGATVLSRSGLLVSAGGHDETIRAWSLAGAELVWEWTEQAAQLLASSPSERYLVIATGCGKVRIVSVANGSEVASFRLDASASAVRVHPRQPLIAVGDVTGRAHVFCIRNCADW